MAFGIVVVVVAVAAVFGFVVAAMMMKHNRAFLGLIEILGR